MTKQEKINLQVKCLKKHSTTSKEYIELMERLECSPDEVVWVGRSMQGKNPETGTDMTWEIR